MKLRHSLLYAIRHHFVNLVLSSVLVGFGIYGLATFEPVAPNALFSSPISDHAWVIHVIGVVCGLGGLLWIAHKSR
ncbi:hypothetical protein [Xanthomonas vasicola]|uniref:Uncharacterized protein n=1 Tax=Xanthomonas vasicola TaxID=56459 RepID=A0ABD7S6A6_XANVA|nr:hypothetical protein [Xanthomonas vasicola]RNK53689.1 hypothetical protein C9393_15080 [Xanthomonas vasicola pv. vasculorum]RNK62679.1 hypothetical protein C9402_01170 [Xanthomonas vasicola pv. vasculorum]RNK70510.1 hypothetical protein C9399_00140 [Xanthomonas vasicola pv. vasculorum]RNK74392.1 hypothetical protein C9388_20120 [Xanthomonas vasicola pv. vasculorum]RNK74998.1 hypothetical protein C9391_00510 [Xanthomonas vasicola pv. vasculorum]